MVMMAVALLERHPQPDEATIRAQLSGNLCRCGTQLESFARCKALALDGLAVGAGLLGWRAAMAPVVRELAQLPDGDIRAMATLFGVNISLALNTNLHSDRPDNLLQVIVHSIREPAAPDIGFMPAFGTASRT